MTLQVLFVLQAAKHGVNNISNLYNVMLTNGLEGEMLNARP